MPRRSLIVEEFLSEIWSSFSEDDQIASRIELLGNRACSLEFLEDVVFTTDKIISQRELSALARNSNIPVEFFAGLKSSRITSEYCINLVNNPNIPFEFLLAHRVEFKMVYNSFDLLLVKRSDCPWSFVEQIPSVEMDDIHKTANPNVPYAFAKKVFFSHRKFPLGYLANPNVSVELLLEYKNYLPDSELEFLCSNPHIPIEFFEEIDDRLNPEMKRILYRENPNIRWSSLTDLSEGDLIMLFRNKTVPLWFVEQHLHTQNNTRRRHYFETLTYNSGLPEEFFEKYYDEIMGPKGPKFVFLARNPALSVDFFRRHPDLLAEKYQRASLPSNTFDYQFVLESDQNAIDDARVALTKEDSNSLPSLMLGVLHSQEEVRQRRARMQYRGT